MINSVRRFGGFAIRRLKRFDLFPCGFAIRLKRECCITILAIWKAYGCGFQIRIKVVEPFLSADCKSAGTPNGLASMYYGLMTHPIYTYFPMQKCLKILFSVSWLLICPPVISPNSSNTIFRSSAMMSPLMPISIDSNTRERESWARSRAS